MSFHRKGDGRGLFHDKCQAECSLSTEDGCVQKLFFDSAVEKNKQNPEIHQAPCFKCPVTEAFQMELFWHRLFFL